MTGSEVAPPAVVAVLRGLAANAGLDLELLRPLLDSSDLLTLTALAERADLTRAAAITLARQADPTLRRSLARNPVAARHVWSALAAGRSAACLAQAATWNTKKLAKAVLGARFLTLSRRVISLTSSPASRNL